MLYHKGEAIRLLNDKFSNLESEDIEAVLVGMLVVFPEEEEVVSKLIGGRVSATTWFSGRVSQFKIPVQPTLQPIPYPALLFDL